MRNTPLILALLAGLSLSGAAQATLIDRGGGLIYDDVLKITWLQDANYAKTSGYAAANAVDNGSAATNNIFADGRMGWDAAKAWADNLVYGGYDNWRLPTMIDTDGPDPDALGNDGCNYAFSGTDCGYNVQTYDTGTVYSELAYMFYVNLGNKGLHNTSGSSQAGSGLVDDLLNKGKTIKLAAVVAALGASVGVVPNQVLAGETGTQMKERAQLTSDFIKQSLETSKKPAWSNPFGGVVQDKDRSDAATQMKWRLGGDPGDEDCYLCNF